jgi:hypothetical protein
MSRCYAAMSYRFTLEVEGEKNLTNAKLAAANAR